MGTVAHHPRSRPSPASFLAAHDLAPLPTALLAASALAVAVGGYEHAHLYHDGYSTPTAIGVLFILNAVSSIAVVLLLLARRPALYAFGAIGISVGSIVGILFSHSSSGLFGLREGAYTTDAKIAITAEIVATVLILAAVGIARVGLLPSKGPRA